MQIALTKKLADAMGVDLSPLHEVVDPLFSWTANWTKVWDNSRAEDMLVLVNNGTRFVVAIYQVKRKDLKNVAKMMKMAISNTLLSMNLNPGIVEEYLHRAGKVEFIRNQNRQAAAWVTKAGHECAFHVGREYNGVAKVFNDAVGTAANRRFVGCSGNNNEGFYLYEAMFNALSELTGKQIYKYRAFELLITLDLDLYKATRRVIVPANIEFANLHKVLQSIFGWRNYHLYDFVIEDGFGVPIVRLVPFGEDLEYDENATLMNKLTLSEFMPDYKQMIYTYDMGDYWQHKIELLQVYSDCDKESPYLLEASGQTPPEDVGGVGGFMDFRQIMLNSSHSEYDEMKKWAGYWTPELSDWHKRPRLIHIL